MFYLFLMTLGIICLTCVIPVCQFVCYKFFPKNEIVWLFSDSLFNRHINANYVVNPSLMIKVVNDREEMQALWDEEMKHNLP